MNIRLRAIKTFLLWLKDNDQIRTVPKIKMQNVGKPLPIYITNSHFLSILKQVSTLPIQRSGSPDLFTKAFILYSDTGMRLAEPFNGTLNGQFLTITVDTAKGHSQRDIYLNPEQIQILLEMREYIERQVSLISVQAPLRDGRLHRVQQGIP